MKNRKSMFKKTIALAVALVMCATMLPTAAFAASADATPDLIISDAEGLMQFAAEVNNPNDPDDYESALVVLDRDIDMTGFTMSPIGIENSNGTILAFKGIFDGQGHTISNLSLSYNGTDNIKIGLFGYVEGNGSVDSAATFGIVKRLNLSNVDVSNSSAFSNDEIESSAGVAVATLNKGLIDSVSTDDTCSATGVYRVGGICGDIRSTGRIQNCNNYAEVNGSSQYAGGIVGATHEFIQLFQPTARGAHITNCKNFGSVSGAAQVGGIVGYSDRSVISQCENDAPVTGTTSYGTGGIAGADIYNPTKFSIFNATVLSEITSCTNKGTVTAPANGGGILGAIVVTPGKNQPNSNIYSILNSCKNYGTISGPTATCGGIYGNAITYANGSAAQFINHLWVDLTDCHNYTPDGQVIEQLSPSEYKTIN